MKIDVIKLVPKGWEIKEKGVCVKLFYYNERPQNNPKNAIQIPKFIEVNEQLMEGIGLFLGDGDLNRKEKGHLGYVSRDKDIAKCALDFLLKNFNLDIANISFYIQYRKENKKIKEEWSSFLKIPQNKIGVRYSKRHKNECIQIQVNSVIFRKIFGIILKEILTKNFIKKKQLRRGLLRGLFAAEGNVGVDYKEKKPYISQITFSLHIKEDHIAKIITDILEEENIGYSVSERKKRNTKEIIIYNWKNYKKLWEINLFNLCKRKKDIFLKVLSNLSIYCILEDEYLVKLFKKQKLFQREIATLIGSWQGNVSKTNKGIHKLKMEQFHILSKRVDESNIINKIKSIRVGSLTTLENNDENKDFINYLYNLKVTKI